MTAVMKYVSLFLAVVLLAGCIENTVETGSREMLTIDDVPQQKWDRLAEKKIYFGHQSVGGNIIDGLKDVMAENPRIRLNIVESNSPEIFDTPAFAHSKVGKNVDPGSKIKAFAEIVEKGVGDKYDLAFFKFCFVDILPGTDLDNVLDEYTKTMSGLKTKYPETTFIHFTVPLTSDFAGLKALIKKAKDMIKIVIGETNYYDNANRNRFNEMLRQEYAGKEPVFDLAALESISADGQMRSVQTLLPEYTDDGGHLNEYGRKLVAEQLLIKLALLAH